MSAAKKLSPVIIVDKALEEIMVNFVQNRINDLTAIETAVFKGDWEEARRYAHIVAGVSGGYGFTELGEQARLIEKYIESKDRDKIIASIFYLKDYLKIVTVIYN
ncbi:MAG: Hpt domain-containing protein [Bdellovibrionota bacterium]